MTDTQPSHLRRTVAIGDLHLDHKFWSNPRSFTALDEDSLDEFGKGLKIEGILVPLHVVRVKLKDGSDAINLVLEGQRRVRAGMRVFPKTHPVEVIDLEPEPIDLTPQKSAELLARVLHIGHREGLSSYELSEAAERLREQGLKLGEIGRAVNKSESWCSRMLDARKHATPKLMVSWKKGEITDEQFKDLAKEKPQAQGSATDQVVAARVSGDKATARAITQEVGAANKVDRRTAGQSKADIIARVNGVNGHAKGAPATKVVTGEQQDLFVKKEPKKDPEGPRPPSRATMEDMLAVAKKKPPTHDYVKGIMSGIEFALGFTNPEKFGKPWVTYLARIEGKAVPKRAKAKPAPRAKRARAAKPKKSGGRKGRK